jgi:hypothetical protein
MIALASSRILELGAVVEGLPTIRSERCLALPISPFPDRKGDTSSSPPYVALSGLLQTHWRKRSWLR